MLLPGPQGAFGFFVTYVLVCALILINLYTGEWVRTLITEGVDHCTALSSACLHT